MAETARCAMQYCLVWGVEGAKQISPPNHKLGIPKAFTRAFPTSLGMAHSYEGNMLQCVAETALYMVLYCLVSEVEGAIQYLLVYTMLCQYIVGPLTECESSCSVSKGAC